MKYRKGDLVKPKHDKDPYVYISHSNVLKAIRNLSGTSFKMWIYFSRHHTRIVTEEKQKYIIDELGIARSTYVSAMDELIKKGFLIKEEGIYVTTVPQKQDIDDYEI